MWLDTLARDIAEESPGLRFTATPVEADTPAVVQLAPGSTLGGRYLSWIAPPHLTIDKPLAFVSVVRVQRSGGAANDLGTDLATLTSTPLPVPLGKSVLAIPAATDWLGITREAQQISYEVVDPPAVGAIDFNDGTPTCCSPLAPRFAPMRIARARVAWCSRAKRRTTAPKNLPRRSTSATDRRLRACACSRQARRGTEP